MLSVAEAQRAILAEVQPLSVVGCELSTALGLTLAEDIHGDADLPPFDKSLMDGFAVDAESLPGGQAPLAIIETVIAGSVPTKRVEPGLAAQIMTGAPVPRGATAVVPIEETEVVDANKTVRIRRSVVHSGENILKRGQLLTAGEKVLPAGRRLRFQELGVLAELGRPRVLVYPRPRVAVLATGNELVPVGQPAGPGQIRNSNEMLLTAQLRSFGAEAVPLGIARDERAPLREKIEQGLTCDVFLLSGGVSAGQLDLVPSELATAGVRPVFHQVEMRPGKPVWFGVLDKSQAPTGSNVTHPRFVFGLPGNPVSSLACFELFVKTALRRLMGIEPALPQPVRARLETAVEPRAKRTTYFPAALSWSETGPTVRLVPWQGSSDLRGTAAANAMALFPPGDFTYKPGDVVDVFSWTENR